MQRSTKKRTGRPRKSDNWTPKNLTTRAEYYFGKCDSRTKRVLTKDGAFVEVDNPAPYTMAGLCVSLGITRWVFRKWMEDDKLGETARIIHERVVDNRVTGGLDGSQTASFAQFDLKNIDPENYQDRSQVVSSIDDKTAEILNRSLENWTVKD